MLAAAAAVTVAADRESDIYAQWATLPGENVHLLTRVMRDRAVAGGGALSSVAEQLPFVATRTIALRATHKRGEPSQAASSLRFGAARGAQAARRRPEALARESAVAAR